MSHVSGRLPDFVIAGEMKTGTTSLAFYLDAHPEVYVSPTRPVRFFDERFDRGLDWYRMQFASAPAGAVVGDDTPNYLFDDQALARLAGTLPSARVIVFLRDPVYRAWSHYWHHVRSGFERRDFAEAVHHELAHGVGRLGSPEGSGYVGRGRYLQRIRRLLEHVPREAVFLGFNEELRDDRATTFGAVCRFLGVDDRVVPANVGVVYNVGWAPRWTKLTTTMFRLHVWARLPPAASRWLAARTNHYVAELGVPDDVAAELVDHYDEHNLALAEFLGRPLPGWRRLLDPA
ncbi:hypothetical protein BH24ACT3_BH24ACT3_05720 [soil metagenome]